QRLVDVPGGKRLLELPAAFLDPLPEGIAGAPPGGTRRLVRGRRGGAGCCLLCLEPAGLAEHVELEAAATLEAAAPSAPSQGDATATAHRDRARIQVEHAGGVLVDAEDAGAVGQLRLEQP